MYLHAASVNAGLGLMPQPEALLSLEAAGEEGDPVADPPAGVTTDPALTANGIEATQKANQMVPTGDGLPALSRKIVEKILANDYVEFSELPPAKGKVRALNHSLEGQVILVQAEDLLRSKKLIPDLATWVQCFTIYVAVLAKQQPARVPDLMGYAAGIAKASNKFKWPAWVIYDQSFRQEAVGSSQPWAKIEPSIYSQCFLGMAKDAEGWCQNCHSLDHPSSNCPMGTSSNPRKRPWQAAVRQHGESSNKPTCLKFNRNDGECPFGMRCRFAHCCSRCKGNHPIKRCPVAGPHTREKPLQ